MKIDYHSHVLYKFCLLLPYENELKLNLCFIKQLVKIKTVTISLYCINFWNFHFHFLPQANTNGRSSQYDLLKCQTNSCIE